MVVKHIDFDQLLGGPHAVGRVDRTVGDSVFYVSLPDGDMLGLQSERVLVRTKEGLSRYRGESFRQLGLVHGAKVEVYGLDDPDLPDCVVVDVEEKASVFHKLFR